MATDVNLAGRISHFFAVNRPLSILLLLVALVFGLVSFFLTPKQYNPEITRPAFAVTVPYNGATPKEAIERVVYELVEKIDTVPGVDDVYTEVTDGALIRSTVIFEVGYDSTKAKLDLLSQLEQHSYLARGQIGLPQVLEVNPETIPILHIVFGASELTVSDLRQKVVSLSQELRQVEDVSELQVYGGYQTSLVVEVDPSLLSDTGVTISEVVGVLSQSQSRLVAPAIRDGAYTIDMVFDGRATTPAEIGEIVVREGTKVRDVARVYEGVSGERSYVIHQSKEGRGEVVVLAVAKVEGSSAPVVAKSVLSALDEKLLKDQYKDLDYEVVSNDGETANQEIFGLTQNLITSIAIVTVVLLLFLSTRAALVVLIAIPVTLLVVFGLGFLFDQTINRITLFALILSLGLLVDSAIVAVENIYSHLKRWREEPTGHTRERVVAGAVDEIGMGLLLSTITSVIVFLPMNFITGMMGPYMGPIAFFVPAALMVSFMVAIVVTPFVANHILHVETKPSWLAKIFSKFIHRVTQRYTRMLRSLLFSAKKQRLVLHSALGLFIISLILPATGLVHFQMLPKADRDQFYVYVDLPVGTDRELTKKITNDLTDILVGDADVISVQEFIATPPVLDFNGMFKGAQLRDQSNQATVRVNLTTNADRKRSSTEVANALRAEVLDELSGRSDHIRFIEEPPGPPVRATLVAKLAMAEETKRAEAATLLEEVITGVAGVVDTHVSEDEKIGRVRYQFDYPAAAALGVSPASVAAVMGVLGGSYEVTELLREKSVEYTPILLELPAAFHESPNFIDLVSIQNNVGETVPLRSVLVVEHELRPSSVQLEGSEVVSYVTAEVQDRSIVYVTIELIRLMINVGLPGYEVEDWNLWGMDLLAEDGSKLSLTWGGEWEMTLENFRDLGIAMGVALLMVYGLLVAQYNKFSTPAFILVTVPLGLVGILWGFLVLDSGFDLYLTATALIGFIALIGLVVNNAIIFLEYVEQARQKGLAYKEALVAAGGARLRPIFLTSLTTVLGSLTIASDPVWSGLAWAIIFGLSLSTVLTLVIYPTLLVYFAAEEDEK